MTEPVHVHPPDLWDGDWVPDTRSVGAFARILVGETVTVVKRDPDGTEATRYPAVRVATDAPSPWIELVAEWTVPNVEVAGLRFVPGDTVREFFSAEYPYNAFAVVSPDGELRGWYGNVTYPAFFDKVEGEQVLVWHDLYLDVVILADGTMHLMDDDELEESGIPAQDPAFAAAIVQARLDLIAAIPLFG
jgi:hypothetical protein